MAIGKLIHRVIFYVNSPTAAGAGFKDSYSTLLTTRGYLRRKSGSRNLSFGAIQNQTSCELYVRYQTLLENNLRSDVKISVNGKLYTIESWEKVEEKAFYYKFEIHGELSSEFDSSRVFSDEFSNEFE